MRRLIVHCSLLIIYWYLLAFTSCIEPPLKLPAEEVIVDMPTVITDIEVVWNLDIDWQATWHYGWDAEDERLWGKVEYPIPTSYEVRRYFLGDVPGVPHTNVEGFTIYANRFRRSYQFGYYDLLLWSNIDSKDGTQVVTIDEKDLDAVKATTTVTRGLTRADNAASSASDETRSKAVTGLYNQPEIFYSTFPRDIYISRSKEDYDYYDEAEKCWVKYINCELTPMVYIYLVQVILVNNNGVVTGTSGNAAVSAFTSSSNVNTGHTDDNPAMIYFNMRYKPDMTYEGQPADIIGGKLTTYGLCDMASYIDAPDHIYNGSRTDLPNYLLVDLRFSNGAEKTMQYDVTEQCRQQSHGGIITVVVDCSEIEVPEQPESGSGSLFLPTIEDYDEVIYDIPL